MTSAPSTESQKKCSTSKSSPKAAREARGELEHQGVDHEGEQPKRQDDEGQREQHRDRLDERVDDAEEQGDEHDGQQAVAELVGILPEVDAGDDERRHPEGDGVDTDLDRDTHGVIVADGPPPRADWREPGRGASTELTTFRESRRGARAAGMSSPRSPDVHRSPGPVPTLHVSTRRAFRPHRVGRWSRDGADLTPAHLHPSSGHRPGGERTSGCARHGSARRGRRLRTGVYTRREAATPDSRRPPTTLTGRGCAGPLHHRFRGQPPHCRGTRSAPPSRTDRRRAPHGSRGSAAVSPGARRGRPPR